MSHDTIAMLFRLDEVVRRTALSKATIYRLVLRGAFPAPIKLGRASVWRASDVAAWVAALGTDAPGGGDAA